MFLKILRGVTDKANYFHKQKKMTDETWATFQLDITSNFTIKPAIFQRERVVTGETWETFQEDTSDSIITKCKM